MALLLTGATIAFNSILSASGVDQAAQVLSHTFSLARTEAIARQTYTWVGINDINSNQDIQVCVVASVDGTATVGSNGSNLILLEPIRVIRQVHLCQWTTLKAGTQKKFESTQVPSDLYQSTAGASFVVNNTTFTNQTVTFTPHGQAMLAGAPTLYQGYDAFIDCSFQQSHGAVPDDASVVIDGSTGLPSIVQL